MSTKKFRVDDFVTPGEWRTEMVCPLSLGWVAVFVDQHDEATTTAVPCPAVLLQRHPDGRERVSVAIELAGVLWPAMSVAGYSCAVPAALGTTGPDRPISGVPDRIAPLRDADE